MSKYRIKVEVSGTGSVTYSVQVRVLLLFCLPVWFHQIRYHSEEEALDWIEKDKHNAKARQVRSSHYIAVKD